MVLLELNQVSKIYGKGDKANLAVKCMDMQVEKGEIVALLGSSGCGKTSTLRMITGFEQVSSGDILLNGTEIQSLPPVKRNVAMAFEGYSLYPPLTAEENIAFALKSKSLSKQQITAQVQNIAHMLEISDILNKYPSSLSSGQQQRVSLARALIRDADLFLLDEPMGQLEPQLRSLLRGRIKAYIKQKGLTVILVTHDQTEANALADKIAVMENGVLQQFASPDYIRQYPANIFTGTFIGEPPINIIPISVKYNDDKVHFAYDDNNSMIYPTTDFSTQIHDVLNKKDDFVLGVRPHAIYQQKSGIPAYVTAVQWLGDQTHIGAKISDDIELIYIEHSVSDVAIGDTIYLKIDAKNIHIFDTDTEQALTHGDEINTLYAQEYCK